MTEANKPIRILHVLGGMRRGGIETWLMRVLRGIDRGTLANDIVVHTKSECDYDAEARQLGSRLFPCPCFRRPWRYAAEFKRIVRDHGPYDVVHSHCYLYSGFILRLAAGLGVPTRIAHVYPSVDKKRERPLRGLYRRVMTRWISKHATSVVACSRNSLAAIEADCDTRHLHTDVVPLIVELDRFDGAIDRNAVRRKHGLPLDRPIVVYVARFVPHKNHEQLLRVADLINRESAAVHFVLVGSGGSAMPQVIQNVAGRSDVTLLRGLADVSEVLRAADLFFFPSLNEGFGVVAIEAAAAGLPVVATDLPTIREACAPSLHSYFFPANDDRRAIESIRVILANETLRERLAKDGRRFARQFSAENSIRKLTELYTSCARRAA